MPLVVLFATTAPTALSQSIDPHELFESRCGRCHGHSGDFAQKALDMEAGELVIRKSRRPLVDFLPRHYGRLSVDDINALLDAFERQLETDGLYQEKCRICHDRARYLARRNLILRDDQLFGRYTDADIKRLLSYHARLSDNEQAIIYDMLVWQLETAQDYRPD